jgi:hypothetical protein
MGIENWEGNIKIALRLIVRDRGVLGCLMIESSGFGATDV